MKMSVSAELDRPPPRFLLEASAPGGAAQNDADQLPHCNDHLKSQPIGGTCLSPQAQILPMT